jgi:hypothetical protein
MGMKEWHVVVIEDHTIHFDKLYFDVNEARRVYEQKREEYKEQMAVNPKLKVLREYY